MYDARQMDGRVRETSFFALNPALMLCSALSLGLIAVSQIGDSWGDEGFHLLASQLINSGKKPYLDFFYQHVPLYIYLDAYWMRLFGETWRAAHLLSALLTSACIFLVAEFVFSRFRETGWQSAASIAAALLVGLNVLVIQYGTVAQPYALCLFLSMASFRLVIAGVEPKKNYLCFVSGLCAGAAAASSLLTAPIAVVLLVWLYGSSESGDRRSRCWHFIGGVLIPFLPLLVLALSGFRQVFFDVVQFHLSYRKLDYWVAEDLRRWDFKVLTGWLYSSQDLVLALLAAVGLVFVARRDGDVPRRKSEFRLCAWLAGTLGAYLTLPYPTFSQYFVLLIPFLSILATAGIFAIGTRIVGARRRNDLIVVVAGLMSFEAALMLYHEPWSEPSEWQEIEEVAREADRLTPRSGSMFAEERIFFVAHRVPPIGLENEVEENFDPGPQMAKTLHLMRPTEVYEGFAFGRFSTVVLGVEDRWLESPGLFRLYPHREKVGGSYIYTK